jgi:hypothetical protein
MAVVPILNVWEDRAMRPPRMRSTIRGMMAGVAVVSLVVWLIRDHDRTRSLGIGQTSVPLTFLVCDADSGAPIEGAMIRLEDPDYADLPPKPPKIVDLSTGREGRATFVLEAQVYMVRRSSPEWEWRIRYPSWQMRVVAGDYAEFSDAFTDYAAERGGVGFHKGVLPPPSPPIVVKLHRRDRTESAKRASFRL